MILNFPSDLNGIFVNISVMDPLIKWTQTPNPLYPTCITEYVVTDQGNQSLTITVDSTVTSLTTQQLREKNFPYCINIRPTVTPRTPMGDLTSVMSSSNLYTYLIDPSRCIDFTLKSHFIPFTCRFPHPDAVYLHFCSDRSV